MINSVDLKINLSQLIEVQSGKVITVTQPILSICEINPVRFNKLYTPIEFTDMRLFEAGFTRSDIGSNSCFTYKIDEHTIFEFFFKQKFFNLIQGSEFSSQRFIQFTNKVNYFHELQDFFHILAKKKIYITR